MAGGGMYAVIRSGGKQYRVEPGETIEIERLDGEVGGKITFDDVLAVRTDEKKILSGSDAAKAKVTGKIVRHMRGPKMQVLKFKRCGQYKIQRGHRQGLTAVEVDVQLA
jgi:large subunit ribosomal protein L21